MSSPPSPGDWSDPTLRPAQPAPPPLSLPPAAPPHPGAGYQAPLPTPGYPYPPGPGYVGFPAPPPTNGMAVASMVVSIVSAVSLLCSFCFTLLGLISLVGGAVGLILGIVARRQIRERGGRGDGLALAGIITGAITAAIGILFVVATLALFGLVLGTGLAGSGAT